MDESSAILTIYTQRQMPLNQLNIHHSMQSSHGTSPLAETTADVPKGLPQVSDHSRDIPTAEAGSA